MGILLLKGAIGAVIVIAVDLLGQTKNYYFAGLVIMFPSLTLISHWLIGSSRGVTGLQDTITFGALSLIPYGLYLVCVYLIAPLASLSFALLAGIGTWLISAALIVAWLRS